MQFKLKPDGMSPAEVRQLIDLLEPHAAPRADEAALARYAVYYLSRSGAWRWEHTLPGLYSTECEALRAAKKSSGSWSYKRRVVRWPHA